MNFGHSLRRVLLFAPILGVATAMAQVPIEIGEGLEDVKHLSRINGELYYYADDALFRVDPVYDAGTLTDFDVITVTASAAGISHWGLTDATTATVTNFFYATHNEFTGSGALWRSDGSGPGTVQVETLANRITGITHLGGGNLLFANDTGPGTDSTLWLTDGTVGGAEPVTGVTLPGQVRGLTTVGAKAFFTIYNYPTYQYQLWVTDGTGAGTQNLTPPGGFNYPISYWYLKDIGGTLYFPVGSEGLFEPPYTPPSDFALWKSDGTVDGTSLVTATVGLEIPINFRVQQDNGTDRYLWFSTFSNRDEEYWSEVFRLDTNTNALELIKGGLDTVFSSDMTVSDNGSNLVYFAEYNEDLGISTIWRSDGSPWGTFVFLDNLPEVHDLTCVDGILYYASYPFPLGGGDYTSPWAGAMPLGDPPLDGTWTGALLGMDQSGVSFTGITLGSALAITPGELGQAPGTEFTAKPAVWSLFRDLVKSSSAANKTVKYKVAAKPSVDAPTGTILAEWTKKYLLYNKKTVKGLSAANLPTLSPARINGLSVLAEEFSPDALSLTRPLLLAPPIIRDIGGISGPPITGETMVVNGILFGAKPPKLYVEFNPKGDGILKRKACKAVSAKVTPLRFMNAAGKPNASCMLVRPDDPELTKFHGIGYSEIRYVYPEGIVNPTGWFILDNGLGYSTWQQP